MVPWGFCVAETDQSSSSEERSSKSRQSETALERSESPKPEPNSERMEVTSCNTSTTVFTVPANSEGETFRYSNPTLLPSEAPITVGKNKRKKKKKSVGDKCLGEESFIVLCCVGTRSGSCIFKERRSGINSSECNG